MRNPYHGFRQVGQRKAKLSRVVNQTVRDLFKKGINAKAVCRIHKIPMTYNKQNDVWGIDFVRIPTKKLSGINSELRRYL